jgi:hypothetical protein
VNLFRNKKIPFFCIFCLLAFSACEANQGLKDFWKDTKGYYFKYLNTPATFELTDTSVHPGYMLELGADMSVIDEELRQLTRVMDDSDRGPDEEWAAAVFRRFPWLAGLAILDGDGSVTARIPEYSLKEFDAQPLLQEDKKQRRSSLRAYVQQSPLGPEIYLAKPVYMGDELRAMVVAHFDLRALLALHRNAADVIVVASDTVLWPGIYDIDQTPIPRADWNNIVSGGVSGTLGNEHGVFYWCYSYFANLPIIYALPVEGDFPALPAQLEALDFAEAFAVPK